jgi:hypothetical protein
VQHTSGAPRRPLPRRASAGWAIAALDGAVFVVSLVIWLRSDLALGLFDAATYILLPLVFGGVGAMLTARVPGNPIGPLFLVATTGMAVLVGTQSYVLLGLGPGAYPPGAAWAALLANLVWIPSQLVVLIGVPLVYPDGRLLSPRWRLVPIATVLVVLPVELQSVFSTAPLNDFTTLTSPLADAEAEAVFTSLAAISALLGVPLLALAGASLVVRYRRSDAIGRLQLRWLAAAVGLAVVAASIAFNAPAGWRDIGNSIALVALIAMPVAVGVAIVRYRLYEIDRLISRGISYAIVTLLLLATYGASVLLLSDPLGSLFSGNAIAVAISTLLVAALFQPLRSRVQRIVDRRFDRSRIDGDRTVAAFAARLRHEVDIDALRTDLASTVDRSVRPDAVGLWLRPARQGERHA